MFYNVLRCVGGPALENMVLVHIHELHCELHRELHCLSPMSDISKFGNYREGFIFAKLRGCEVSRK